MTDTEDIGYPIIKQSLYKHLRKENMAYRRKNRTTKQVESPVEKSTNQLNIPVEKPIKYVKPMTDGQADYIEAIAENEIVLCYGLAGTGKTAIATMIACQYLAEGKVDKILLTRPIVGASVKTLGALPGGLAEKFDPYLLPIVEQMNKYFGPYKVKEYLANGTIESAPLELLRGRTFDRCFMVGDEFQNCSFEQITMFLTRIGNDSKMVLNGDFEQTDLKYEAGAFEDVVELLDGVPGIEIVELDERDIVRSPIIKSILRALRGREDLKKVDK